MRNFDVVREYAEQRGDEYIFGAVEKDLAAVPMDARQKYLPAGVRQYTTAFDTNGCASRGPNNIVETKLDYFYDNGMHPNLKKWFDDNGYRVDGKFALNDAYIEILSGTTREGNSLKAPIDTIRTKGAIPAACLPLQEGMTWEQYMDPKRITKAHKDLAAQFLRRITVAYEQVPLAQFDEALEQDLLDVAVHAWPAPVDGVYPKADGTFNHVVARLDSGIYVFDNYEPFVKRLAKDYNFFEWGYSLSITRQTPYPDETVSLFKTLQKYRLLAFFAAALAALQKAPVAVAAPQEPAPPTPPPAQESAADKLAEAAKAMLGRDASPRNRAPQELSCAEGVGAIVNSVWPGTLDPNIVGTDALYAALKKSSRFKPVLDPMPGCIEISPRTADINGHTGIYTEADTIASNDSRDGIFKENYTRASWRQSFIVGRGLKAYLFVPVGDNVGIAA